MTHKSKAKPNCVVCGGTGKKVLIENKTGLPMSRYLILVAKRIVSTCLCVLKKRGEA